MIWWCSICSELLNDIKTTSLTPCGHVFHLECLEKCIIISETCPECRQSISSSLLVKLYPNVMSCTNEINSDINAVQIEKHRKLWDLTCQGVDFLKTKRVIISLFETKFKQFRRLKLLKTQHIESLDSKIADLEEINRQLNIENEHLNEVKTIITGTQLEAEKMLSRYSSNAGEENAARNLASYCSILKCELDRVIGEKKALELNFQEVGYEYSNKNSELTQLQKLVDFNISLLETKRDLSGCDYSKDTPSYDDKQAISMRDNITETGVDYSPITAKFAENEQKIGVRILEDEMPSTSKLSIFNNKKVVLSSSSSLACQVESITRIGYDERPSVVNRTFKENLSNHLIDKKTKSTFSRCESPMSKRKRNI